MRDADPTLPRYGTDILPTAPIFRFAWLRRANGFCGLWNREEHDEHDDNNRVQQMRISKSPG